MLPTGVTFRPIEEKDMPFLMQVDEAATRIIKNLAARPRTYSFPLRLSTLLLLSKLLPGLWQKMVAPKSDVPAKQSEEGAGK